MARGLYVVAILAVLVFACGDDVPWNDGAVRVSPDGFYADAFDWGRDGFIVASRSGALYILEPDSGRFREIIGRWGFAVTRGVCWSPDGKYVAFGGMESDWVPNIYVIARDAGSVDEAWRLTESGGTYPDWSPDGKWIAYGSPAGVSLIPAEGGQPIVEVPGGLNAAWSPGGEYIAYVKKIREGQDLTEIFIKRVGEDAERRLSYFGFYVWDPDWSPEGAFVAFPVKDVKDQERKNDIWVMPAKGGEPIKITDEPGTNYRGIIGADCPRWTPDGKWVAFYSPRGEHIGRAAAPEIWKVRFGI